MQTVSPEQTGVTRRNNTETQSFEEQHFPISHWARIWSFSSKTVREWFRDENGPGILRQRSSGRRKKREYTTITVSATAAARIYEKHTSKERVH
jgi:hypothetical protein